MNDPQKFIWLPLSAAVFLIAVSVCQDADAQSFYQQANTAVDTNGNAVWHPPQTAKAKPQSFIRQATNLAPLKPPRDIFTDNGQQPLAELVKPPTSPPVQSAAHSVAATTWNQFGAGSQTPPSPLAASPPQPERFSTTGQFDHARRLGNSSSQSEGNGLFDSINALTESNQSKFASANLETETTTGRSDFAALTSGASAKLEDVKDWVGDKTGAMFGGLKDGGWQERLSRMFGGADVKKIIGGLAVVIGGYLGLVWLLRMINPAGSGAIPREVLEVVGSAPLNSKQNLQLIRLGSKLMLMIHGPEGTQPIGEVSDPAEVEQLLALCGGRGQRVSHAVGAAIENRLRTAQQPTPPARDVSHQHHRSVNPTVNPTANDTSSLNELLKAAEKYHGRAHLYEA